MKTAKIWPALGGLLISAALLTACAQERLVEVTDTVCPDRATFTVAQAEEIAAAIEALPPTSPLIPYIVDAEGVHAQLDAVCP
ncbi:MAG: hypothetical protein AAF441_21285 [Pseudomonadota bacterium]